MLVVRAIGAGQARYYLDGPSPGTWLGAGRQALSLAGAPSAHDLAAVLAGRDSSDRLLLRRLPRRHRAGFDLVFASPKSVSLLAALTGGTSAEAPPAMPDGASPRGGIPRSGGPWPTGPGHTRAEGVTLPAGPAIVAAHDAAVADTLGYLERRAAWTRRGGAGRRIHVAGLVAGAFRHHSSWSGDPHLHTHVVVANLALGEDGQWSCLDSRSLYHHGRAAGAMYQASLRHHLACAGFGFVWALRPDGLADVAGVPREAIEACSSRRRAILQEAPPCGATAQERAVAAGRTRRLHGTGGEAVPWQDRAAAAGLDATRVAGLAALAVGVGGAPGGASPPRRPEPRDRADDLTRAVESRLSATVSSFGHADCVRTVAALLPRGAPSAAIESVATAFLEQAVPAGRERWTTPLILHRERRLVELARHPPIGVGMARPAAVASALDERPALGPLARAAVTALTRSGSGVELLGRGPLLAQVGVLEAAQAAWEASGHRVAVVSRDARAVQRWQALCGLGPPSPPPRHATVVIVDGADRLSAALLHSHLFDAARRRAKVVLVEGGTAWPGAAAERPFAQLREVLHALEPGSPAPAVPASVPVRGGLDGGVTVAATPHDAIAAVVAQWAEARGGPAPTIMVALGPPEAEALNAEARRLLQREGVLHGPVLRCRGQHWQAGDEIRVLRPDARFGAARAGTVGTVTAVDPATATLTIRWPGSTEAAGPAPPATKPAGAAPATTKPAGAAPAATPAGTPVGPAPGRTTTLSATQLAGAPARHAYATTPSYLRTAAPGPIACLGVPAGGLPRGRDSTFAYRRPHGQRA